VRNIKLTAQHLLAVRLSVVSESKAHKKQPVRLNKK